MALDWRDLIAFYNDAVSISRERDKRTAVAVANAVGRIFGGK